MTFAFSQPGTVAGNLITELQAAARTLDERLAALEAAQATATSTTEARLAALEAAQLAAAAGRSALPVVGAVGTPQRDYRQLDWLCTGTDDQETIAAAVKAAGAAGGVALTGGRYTLGAPAAVNGLTGGFRLVGQGKATTLQAGPGFPDGRGLVEVGYGDGASAPYTSDVELVGLTLDGAGQTGTNVAGLIFGCYRGTISGVTARNVSGYCLRLESPNPANRTDLLLSGYRAEYGGQGALLLGGAASDGHVQHGVVMHAGKRGTTPLRDGAHGIMVRCASVQLDEFHSYGHTGASVLVDGLASNTKISHGKIETSAMGGLVAPKGLWMVQISACGFHAGQGRAQLDISRDQATNQSIFSVTGCTFDYGAGQGGRTQYAIYVDLSGNSVGSITGGAAAGWAGKGVLVKGGQVGIVNLAQL